MTRDVLSNALFLRVLAGVDGVDGRQGAGTPFPAQVPDYPTLLASARAAHALLEVGLPSSATGAAPGTTRKMRIGVLREGRHALVEENVQRCVDAAVQRFKELGAEVVEVSVPMHADAPVIARAQR